MERSHFIEIIEQQIPAKAQDYCISLWDEYPFLLKVKKRRVTKVGDFIWRKGHAPIISVNKELNQHVFLLTYIHEVAHLKTHQQFGRKVKSHGGEWKETFQRLMQPVLSVEIFPQPLLNVLRRHVSNPKASSFSDIILTQELRNLNNNSHQGTLLNDIMEGATFSIRGRLFRKGELKRTRVTCYEVSSKRAYLIRKDAEIEVA